MFYVHAETEIAHIALFSVIDILHMVFYVMFLALMRDLDAMSGGFHISEVGCQIDKQFGFTGVSPKSHESPE